jgi:hypothetical protein
MPVIKNTFHLQTMDKETDKAFVEIGRTRHNENVRFSTSGGNDGVGVNIKGTVKVADLTDGNADFKCVGAEYNESNNTIYYFLATTDGIISKVAEFEVDSESSATILHDTTSILNLKKDGYITGIDEINGLLFFSEWENNPRRVNVEREKTNYINNGKIPNGFTEEDIQVVLIAPHQKPNITLQLTPTVEENYIEELFPYFAYRWQYLDGEYSILSPFSSPAFFPKPFRYDFQEQNNGTMVNAFNQVLIEFQTGNERVKSIQLVFKESQSNTEWIIDDFNKDLLGWGNDVPQTFLFDNSKRYAALSDFVLRDYSSGVPLTSKAQTIIQGRLLYGHYKEYYDLLNIGGSKIEIDYTVELVSESNSKRGIEPSEILSDTIETTHATTPSSSTLTLTGTGFLTYNLIAEDPITLTEENAGAYTVVSVTDTTLVLLKNILPYPVYDGLEAATIIYYTVYKQSPTLLPVKTIKSNRDNEIGITYYDTPVRSTTVLVSKTNTVFIDSSKSVNENSLEVVLINEPPAWAKYYRFFVKQSKRGYDQLLPDRFYEDDAFVWVKLEESDKDKIVAGDYLIVKADTVGIKSTLIRTKVLDIQRQEQNFLEPDDSIAEIIQKAGLYFKVRPKNYVLTNSTLNTYRIETWNRLLRTNITGEAAYIGEEHFYGDTLNDMVVTTTAMGGVFIETIINQQHRYLVEIDGQSPDTFRWSSDNGTVWTAGVPITAGVAQTLANGAQVTFAADVGHSSLDNWAFYARGVYSLDRVGQEDSCAFFRTYGEKVVDVAPISEGYIGSVENEKIRNGANIILSFTGDNTDIEFNLDLIANNNYDNIQEWYYGDNILEKLEAINSEITEYYVHFVRGVSVVNYDGEYWDGLTTNTNLTEGGMVMVIRHFRFTESSGSFEIRQSSSPYDILFETEGKAQPPETYYEIGKTYEIKKTLGVPYHIADSNIPTDVDQADGVNLRVRLDWFNAFSYGNGVESYKIKDEFNRKGLDLGIRTLTTTVEEYKQRTRTANITWSDVYREDSGYNGLSTFNQSQIIFVPLDEESGSIQLLHNSNGNLKVYQEDAIGIMPYNKNIIYDTEGGKVVGVANNVLDEKSYQAYAHGMFGTRHPESFVARGNREYIIDQQRGKLLRMSIDGATPISDNKFEHFFSRLMAENKDSFMVGGYDPKHGEYLFNIPNTANVVELQSGADESAVFSYKEKAGGFPLIYPYNPDYILEANNEVYAWKNGVMYKLNASETRNNFFGVQYDSVLRFFANTEYSVEKVWNNISLQSTHAWLAKIKTSLTGRTITKESFTKLEDYWFSEIMPNTQTSNSKANSSYGLGTFAITNGVIETSIKYASLSIGDYIFSNSLTFTKSKVVNITATQIVLEDDFTAVASFLIYEKNQAVDGSSIRGDILEVELISSETEKVELRAVGFDVTKSNIS